MNKYTKVWTEIHECTVEAETEKEAELYIQATEHELTLVKTVHETMTALCASHRIAVNEDQLCMDCIREESEERKYEESK